jgi:hypothetical protein
MIGDIAGETGLIKLTLAILAGCALITFVAGLWAHWFPALLAIIVGWSVLRALSG